MKKGSAVVMLVVRMAKTEDGSSLRVGLDVVKVVPPTFKVMISFWYAMSSLALISLLLVGL